MTIKKLIGTLPSQISRNRDLGSMAFMDAGGISITGGNIEGIDKLSLDEIYSKVPDSAIDVFIYDTRKDSDGGKWRFLSQKTSWYNETLNTQDRGGRKEFPSVALLVVTSTTLTIYDLDDPATPMWMVFLSSTTYPLLRSGGLTCVAALNGEIYVGHSSGSGLHKISMIEDSALWITGSASYGGLFPGSIKDRNVGASFSYFNNKSNAGQITILDSSVNDISLVVTPGTPIYTPTGLPRPTVAVAIQNSAGSNGGYSIIFPDNTVKSATFGQNICKSISFMKNGEYVVFETTGYTSVSPVSTLPWTSGGYVSSNIKSINAGWCHYYWLAGVNSSSIDVASIDIGPGLCTAWGDNNVAVAGLSGFSIHNEELLKPSNGMVAHISSNFNTGWLPGNIKGAWLSDTTEETLYGTELITNGSFASNLTGWTLGSGDSAITWVSGAMQIARGSGSNNVYQSVATTPGKRYMLTFTAGGNVNGVSLSAGTSTSTMVFIGNYSPGIWYYQFTAASSQTFFNFGANVAGTTVTVDDVSCREMDPDRSVQTVGLQAISNGANIVKTKVAPNADLVGYWVNSNSYFIQPYCSNTNALGTTWTFMTWLKRESVDNTWDMLLSRSGPSAAHGDGIGFRTNAGTSEANLTVSISGSGSGTDTLNAVSRDWTQWQHVAVTCDGSGIKFYVNGVLTSTTASSVNFTFPNNTYYWAIGCEAKTAYSATPIDGRNKYMALTRLSGTAATADQLKKIYRDERVLFNENAKATIGVPGVGVGYISNGDAVKALAIDTENQQLHIGTYYGRSVFENLSRVDYVAHSLDSLNSYSASISASNGIVAAQ